MSQVVTALRVTINQVNPKGFFDEVCEQTEFKLWDVFARVRHFVDFTGYSLSKHNDSKDTLVAIIAPLLPYTTPTSIFTGGTFDRNYPRVCSIDTLRRTAFVPDLYYPDLPPTNSDVTYTHYEEKSEDDRLAISLIPWNCSTLPLQPGEATIIPNHTAFPFVSDASNKTELKAAGHGVFPPVPDVFRPLLLIDYMMVPPGNTPDEKPDSAIVPIGTFKDFISRKLK